MSFFLSLAFLLSNLVFAQDVEVKVTNIKLNSADSMGMFKVDGGITLLVDSLSQKLNFLKMEFSVKTAGIGIAKTEPNTHQIKYDEIINLIQGETVTLPGFNKEAVLTSLVINQPTFLNSVEQLYDLKINFLKAFGKETPAECQEYETIHFTMLQKGLEFQLYVEGIKNPVDEIKLSVETKNKHKKLSHIEIRSLDKKMLVMFKDCVRLENLNL